MRALVSEQKAYILDVKVGFTLNYVWVLMEWQEDIPACFREEEVPLAEEVIARVMPLQVGEEAMEG